MPIDAFIMRHAGGMPFVESFLQSQDFESDGITAIARRAGVPTAIRGRELLVQHIAYELNRQSGNHIYNEILRQLVARKKTWMSVKVGSIRNSLQGRDPAELIYSGGDAQWYGPLSHPDDNSAALWYVRPHFRKHGEISSDRRTVEQVYIRWLVFARVIGDAISLHWRGFSHLPIEDDVLEDGASTRNIQFGYWYHIPEFFDEIQHLLGADVEYVNLQQVVLHRLWDTYLSTPGYQWKHRRIRAESSGVAINAHAGGFRSGVIDLQGQGISHLASTIRRAVALELQEQHDYTLLNPKHFDDIILRTIIREYGALSYEFSLERHGELLFRAHSYFGDRKEKPSQDSFPHLKIVELSELKQLDFLLSHAR